MPLIKPKRKDKINKKDYVEEKFSDFFIDDNKRFLFFYGSKNSSKKFRLFNFLKEKELSYISINLEYYNDLRLIYAKIATIFSEESKIGYLRIEHLKELCLSKKESDEMKIFHLIIFGYEESDLINRIGQLIIQINSLNSYMEFNDIKKYFKVVLISNYQIHSCFSSEFKLFLEEKFWNLKMPIPTKSELEKSLVKRLLPNQMINIKRTDLQKIVKYVVSVFFNVIIDFKFYYNIIRKCIISFETERKETLELDINNENCKEEDDLDFIEFSKLEITKNSFKKVSVNLSLGMNKFYDNFGLHEKILYLAIFFCDNFHKNYDNFLLGKDGKVLKKQKRANKKFDKERLLTVFEKIIENECGNDVIIGISVFENIYKKFVDLQIIKDGEHSEMISANVSILDVKYIASSCNIKIAEWLKALN